MKKSGWADWNAKANEHKRNADKKRRLEKQAFVLDYLGSHPCVDCGEADVIVLEFDHVRGKTAPINNLIVGWANLQGLKNEIALCDVRCANCHKRRHAKEGKNYRAA